MQRLASQLAEAQEQQQAAAAAPCRVEEEEEERLGETEEGADMSQQQQHAELVVSGRLAARAAWVDRRSFGLLRVAFGRLHAGRVA